jgi:hypothetical protein
MPGWPARTTWFSARQPLQVEVGLGSSRRNPVRILLTIIATLMIVGLVMQVGVMFNAYQRVNEASLPDATAPAAEKAYLQDVYQTYGIRAASKEEAELLLADMRRKEAAERDQMRSSASWRNRSAPSGVSRKSRAASVRRWQPPISVPKRRRNDSARKRSAARKRRKRRSRRPN